MVLEGQVFGRVSVASEGTDHVFDEVVHAL